MHPSEAWPSSSGNGQVRVPFVHWMAIGIPMVIVLVPVAAAVILWSYPPELDPPCAGRFFSHGGLTGAR